MSWYVEYVIVFEDGREKTTTNVTIAESYKKNPEVKSIILYFYDENGKYEIEKLK